MNPSPTRRTDRRTDSPSVKVHLE